MSDEQIKALEDRVHRQRQDTDGLEARVRRIESALFIQKLRDQPVSPEVRGLLEALKKLPQGAPYIDEDDDGA